MTGAFSKSAEAAQAINKLINVQETQNTARDLCREMEKAGLIEEIMEDVTAFQEDADLDEEVEIQVDQVLLEITKGILSGGKKAPIGIKETEKKAEVEESEELDEMKQRLDMLKQV